MEPENQPSREELKRSTDPQQSEMDLNIFGDSFQGYVGDTKGRKEDEAGDESASQTGGVDEQAYKADKDA